MESARFFPEIGRRWRNLSTERAWLAIGIAIVCALFIFVFSWERCFFDGCPDVASLAAYQPGGAPVLLDRHGEPFADLTPVEQRIVPLSSLPSHVAQAFIAVEDQRFQEHHGIDLRRVGGALLNNLRSGDFEQGFSTITMQVARNVFPDRIPGQDRSLSRKLTEIRVAKEIEQRYSKQEILELYLNHIYFGNRAHGIDAASRQYFGVPAEQLTLPQAALLAALPKAPSHYDPRRHPEAARERRDLVLALMEQQRRIPRYIAEQARREPLGIVPPPRHVPTESGLAPYFVEQVRRELEDRFGADLYRQPLRVRTTLDARLQRAAEEELSRQLRRIENGELGKFAGPRYSPETETPPDGTPYLQGAVVLLDARGGDVLAWVGGRDFAQSQFDRAAQAQRQPGSAFKPFVYAAALRDGWVLSQPLVDLPLTLRLPDGRIWKPRNFGASYERQVSVRDALVRSKNVATVRLANAVGLADVAQAAQRAGLDEPLSKGPAMALGTEAVSPVELTAAYTAFATLGTAAEPRRILSIEDADGRVLWSSEPQRSQVLDPGVSYLITDVLSDALDRGTGYRVRESGVRAPAAGKTGTTNDGADAWFVGYTPEVAAGIWIGFDQPKPIVEDAAGGRVAAPIWASLIRRAYAGRSLPQSWKQPEGVVSRSIDPATGLVLKNGCAPLRGAARRELFLEEAVPAAWCPGREPLPARPFPVQVRQDAEAQRARAEQQEQREDERRDEERLAQLREAERQAKERQAAELAQAKAEKAKHDRLVQERKQRATKAEEERQARLDAQKETQQKERDAARERQLREEREARQERLEKQKEQKEREERLAAREAELKKEEEKLLRRERQRDPESESEVADVEVEEPKRDEARTDLSGWWDLTNRIQKSKVADFVGLRLGYQIKLEQDGNRITGRGRKSSEDGRAISGSARTPIRVSGRIEGDTLHLTFTEEGARRSSTGGFDLELSADRTSLRGGFWSDVAGTKGSTLARRMP
jgi:penicillin-binding protein 1A